MSKTFRALAEGDCTAVIVSWNCREHLARCLSSISESAPEMSVIVVDNASTDGTPETVRDSFPGVKLIEAGSNLGFAAANNIGASAAGTRLLFFLNPDTVVLPGAVDALAAALDSSRERSVALAGPRLEFPDGRDQPSAFGRYPGLVEHALVFNPIALAAVRRLRPGWDRSLLVPQPRVSTVVAHVNGAAMLTTAEAFRRVGGFDERFFVYFEETDLCRSYEEAGYRIAYVPEATVVHYMGGSSGEDEIGQSSPIHLESMYLFYRKHYGRARAAAAYCLAVMSLVINVFVLRALAALGATFTGTQSDSARTWKRFSSRALAWHLSNAKDTLVSR